jgi:putative endonuclease
MIYFVYILYSPSTNHFYVGHTNNIDKRIEQHNAGRTISTKRGRPWTVVYKEDFPSKAAAYNRELEIKSIKSKVFIEKLINSKA